MAGKSPSKYVTQVKRKHGIVTQGGQSRLRRTKRARKNSSTCPVIYAILRKNDRTEVAAIYKWMTVTAALFMAVACGSRQAGYRRFPAGKLLLAAAAENAVYGLLLLTGADELYPLALAAGLGAALLYGLVRREGKLLPQVCVDLCAVTALLPCCFAGGWQYAFYPYALILAVLAASWKTERAGPPDYPPEGRGASGILSCAALIPELALLAVLYPEGPVSAAVMSGAFLALDGLALWLQSERVRRGTAEELSRAMAQWQQESRDYMNTIRSQRHDFNLHLHAISGLLGSGQYGQCGDYVRKLVAEANAVNDIMPVSDAVVGSMLYNMREEARRRGSDIIYDITYDMAGVLCNGFECNKIIGNLLQNALDALRSPEDKAYGIRLSIFKRRGNTVAICENRFTGDPDRIARVFEPGYSTKKGHEGIGLSMVLRTVRLYGGRIYPEFDAGVIRFVVNIPNKVDLPKGGAVHDDTDADPG